MPRRKMLQIPIEHAGLTIETLEAKGKALIEEGRRLVELASSLKTSAAGPKKKVGPRKPKTLPPARPEAADPLEAKPEPAFA